MTALPSLCDDILLRVVSHLADREVLALGHTCAALRHVCCDPALWRQRFAARFAPRLSAPWWDDLSQCPEINWSQFTLASAAQTPGPPAPHGTAATVLVGVGDVGARVAALTAVALRPDGNLRPSGFPYGRPRLVLPFRARCCNLSETLTFLPPSAFLPLPLGKCVPRTVFLDASDDTRQAILYHTSEPPCPPGGAFSGGLFAPSMFAATPAEVEAALGRLWPEEPDGEGTVLCVTDGGPPNPRLLCQLHSVLAAKGPKIRLLAVAVLPASPREATAAGLGALLQATGSVLALDSDSAGALWQRRGEGDPAGSGPETDRPPEAHVAYGSAAQRTLVEEYDSLAGLPVGQWPAPQLGAAAVLAGCLRTTALVHGMPPGVFTAGVSPVLPLSPYSIQTPEQAHSLRMHHVRLA
eukprot:EG_transcript_14346